MNDNTESTIMEKINKSPYLTMKQNLSYPINELVAWGVFGDSTFLESDAFLYSNYSELDINSASMNTAHIELMNSIERDVKQFIADNSYRADLSTKDSTYNSINNLLNDFLLQKYEDLNSLIKKKNSIFEGFVISWAALVIAYREMALFAFANENYYVAMQLNEFCRECQAQMVFKNFAFIEAHRKELSNKYKEIGSKGGSKKGVNYREPKERALNYHDKHFGKQLENGKFIYSSAAAARKIVSHFDKIEQSLGYEDNSLANIIAKHRKQHFTK